MNIDDILEIQEIFDIDTAQKMKKSLMENFIFGAVRFIFYRIKIYFGDTIF